MKQSYLVQQGVFELWENKEGVDSIIRFAYMGASEYEFGALGNSLNEIRRDLSKYVYNQYSITGAPTKVVTVFCKKSEQDEVYQSIEQLANDKFHLKCCIDFYKWVGLKKSNFGKSEHDFFWDIKNHFMFWKFDPVFETNFKQKIQYTPEAK